MSKRKSPDNKKYSIWFFDYASGEEIKISQRRSTGFAKAIQRVLRKVQSLSGNWDKVSNGCIQYGDVYVNGEILSDMVKGYHIKEEEYDD
jgi:hypothetical protein